MKNRQRGKRFGLEHWQIIAIYLVIYDIIAVNIAYGLALWLRFDCSFTIMFEWNRNYVESWLKFAPFYTIACLAVFWAFRMYNSMWRFASYMELIYITIASGITAIFHVIAITVFFERMPLTYYFLGALIQYVFILFSRFAYRFVLLIIGRLHKKISPEKITNIMLIGAGEAGQMILRDIHKAKELSVERVVCIVDDNENKWNRYIDGVPIIGGRDEIMSGVKKYKVDKIYVAIPSATPEQRRDLLNICKETGCAVKALPGMYQFILGEVTAAELKDINVEDLLGRDPIKVDLTEIFEYLTGKVILVTGGGGSIGSELCRQIASHNPKKLVIFDIYENNAYEIQQELKRNYPDLDMAVEIGSVRDSRRVNQIFATFKPDVVYHAAAHKHVPLMEDSPCEAIKNNVVGTYKTAYAAMIHGCKRFVLISPDKAVNPTNIMGASKRLCEMVIQSFDRKIKENHESELPVLYIHDDYGHTPQFHIAGADDAGYRTARTEFVAVRFGNVLGSNGSVIPLFQKQIETTRVVTVTHPDIIRYFMTIPEAVSLVLEAGTYAKGGEIFVLDMGEPVKIDTLARNLIKLSGLQPDVDVKIEYTGLRPGEKLYEEKLMAEEGMQTTPNHLIHIGNPIPFDTDAFLAKLEPLMDIAYDNREDIIRDKVAELVTTYKIQ